MFASTSARKPAARLVFALCWVLGAVQAWLLNFGIGRDNAIRLGLGVPLVIVTIVSGLAWFLSAALERRQTSDTQCRGSEPSTFA